MRRGQAGFSLLEVMVAVAIMALALVVLFRITTNNVRAAAHSRLVTTATLLARAKISAMEDEILTDGFVDNDQEADGDFSDEGYPHFRWQSLIEAVELPADAAEKAQAASTQNQQEAATGPGANPMSMLTGMMGGMLSTFIEPIRNGLEQSVRKITLRVLWTEVSIGELSFEVVTFMTDAGKLDMALPSLGMPGAGAGGAGGASAATRGTSASTPITTPSTAASATGRPVVRP